MVENSPGGIDQGVIFQTPEETAKKDKGKNKNKQKEKMNQRNKSNTVFVLEIIYTPQLFQNMINRSYMPTHLFQNIQNAQFRKQRG